MERPHYYKFVLINPFKLNYKYNNVYRRMSVSKWIFFPLAFALPRIAIKIYYYVQKLEIWKDRVDDKRREKMAFDFMIFTLSEKEKDIIYENSLL